MKKLFIGALIIIMLFLTGCEGKKEVSLEPFIGGSEGIAINFVDGKPPKEAWDGGQSPFDVELKLQNKGEADVQKGKVRVQVSGIRAQEFDLLEENLVKTLGEELPGMKKSADEKTIESAPVFAEFPNFNHKSFITGATLQYSMRAAICYLYSTTARSKLCVREDILNPAEGGICEIEGAKPVYNSGAPVQAVAVTEYPRTKNKVGFNFEVKHAGTGKVYEKGSWCDERMRKYADRVWVRIDTKTAGLSCSGLTDTTKKGMAVEGYASIIEGNPKLISCTQEVTSGDYEMPVVITMDYDYKQFIDTKITVKHSGEEE